MKNQNTNFYYVLFFIIFTTIFDTTVRIPFNKIENFFKTSLK